MKQLFTRILMIALLAALSPAVVHAQATRTWVSGVGDDANPCSRTAPGKTFAGAISKTAAGGEIDCLDPGGFGAVTLTKSITLDGGGGQVASILVAGTNGININAGPSDVIIIRNLRLQGLGPGALNQGLSGINIIQAGTVVIQNCEIDNFSVDGVHVDTSTACNVSLTSTRLVNCSNDGLFIHSTSSVQTVVTNCEADKCHDGFEVRTGVAAITNTVASNGGTGFIADMGGAISLSRCVTSGNTTGLDAELTSGIVMNDCDIISNSTGILIGGGHVKSTGNNRNVGNTTPGTISGPQALQ